MPAADVVRARVEDVGNLIMNGRELIGVHVNDAGAIDRLLRASIRRIDIDGMTGKPRRGASRSGQSCRFAHASVTRNVSDDIEPWQKGHLPAKDPRRRLSAPP